MFADTAKVSLKAGKGGNGAVSFRHEIYVPKGGPDGGDGGRGGDIIFRADKDTNTLVDFRFTPILTAKNGKNGAGQRAAGRSGEDLIVDVPIGTVVYKIDKNDAKSTSGIHAGGSYSPDPDGSAQADLKSKDSEREPSTKRILLADLTEDGQEVVIAHGGAGGFGNAHFKSSTRQTPMIAEVGEPGEEFEAELELKSVADIGLVGLPNAGKSTFLSVVSNATPEIADYPFTTITPNLGVATIDDRDLLIADIPGLIEGAAAGKGLGHNFLRHVDRTAVLLHLIDVYNNDASAAYQTIRDELAQYSDLAARPEIVALTKCEGVDQDIIAMQEAAILARNPDAQIFAISSSAHQGITELLRELRKIVDDGRANLRCLSGPVGLSGANPRQGGAVLPTWPSRQLSRKTSENSAASPIDLAASSREAHPSRKVLDSSDSNLPTISLPSSAYANTWQVTKTAEGKFLVTGPKIETFARRTDFANYASINRLRDILKKLGIRAELTNQGAAPDSIITIAGHEFTLAEQ